MTRVRECKGRWDLFCFGGRTLGLIVGRRFGDFYVGLGLFNRMLHLNWIFDPSRSWSLAAWVRDPYDPEGGNKLLHGDPLPEIPKPDYVRAQFRKHKLNGWYRGPFYVAVGL